MCGSLDMHLECAPALSASPGISLTGPSASRVLNGLACGCQPDLVAWMQWKRPPQKSTDGNRHLMINLTKRKPRSHPRKISELSPEAALNDFFLHTPHSFS